MKGANSVLTCDRVIVLAPIFYLINFYQCMEFYLIPFKIRKESYSVITGGRITVFKFLNFPYNPLSVF